MLASAYHPDAVDDHGLYVGRPHQFAEFFLAFHKKNQKATQHIITNHTHDIRGDTARCTSYLHAQHVCKTEMGSDQNVLAGYYQYDMVRTDTGWKIKKYSLTVTWATGNHGVWKVAAERMEQAKAS